MRNLVAEILNNEIGANIHPFRDVTISSPFRRDSTPSFRIYAPKDDKEYGSAYDFGTGEYFSPVGIIMRLHGVTYNEAIEHIYINYGVAISKRMEMDDDLSDKIKLIYKFVDDDVMEKAICLYNKNEKFAIDKLIPDKMEL